MLQRLHDRKIRKLVESVKIYAGQNYTDPFQPSVSASDQEIPSEVDQRDPSRFRFSFSQPEEENEESSEEQRRRSIAASAGKHRNRSRKPHHRDRYNSRYIQSAVRSLSDGNPPSSVLRELEDNTDMSFVDKMLWLINEKHLRDSNVYKAAEVDRQCDPRQIPSNPHPVFLCILSLRENQSPHTACDMQEQKVFLAVNCDFFRANMRQVLCY